VHVVSSVGVVEENLLCCECVKKHWLFNLEEKCNEHVVVPFSEITHFLNSEAANYR